MYYITVNTSGNVIATVNTLEEFLRFQDDYFNKHGIVLITICTDAWNNIFVERVKSQYNGTCTYVCVDR